MTVTVGATMTATRASTVTSQKAWTGGIPLRWIIRQLHALIGTFYLEKQAGEELVLGISNKKE